MAAVSSHRVVAGWRTPIERRVWLLIWGLRSKLWDILQIISGILVGIEGHKSLSFPPGITAVGGHGKYLENSSATSEKYVQNCWTQYITAYLINLCKSSCTFAVLWQRRRTHSALHYPVHVMTIKTGIKKELAVIIRLLCPTILIFCKNQW